MILGSSVLNSCKAIGDEQDCYDDEQHIAKFVVVLRKRTSSERCSGSTTTTSGEIELYSCFKSDLSTKTGSDVVIHMPRLHRRLLISFSKHVYLFVPLPSQ